MMGLDGGKALRWGDWEAGFILTVIIDDVVDANPFVSSGVQRIKGLVSRPFPPVCRVRGTVRGSWYRASFNVEVLVISVEWSFAPIDFLKPTSGCPIIRVPQCRIHPHRLHPWVWDSPVFIVLVNSDRKLIHVEPAFISFYIT